MPEKRKGRPTPALARRKRNRRAFPRWRHEFDVQVSWGAQSLACRAYEICEGGLSLSCDQSLPEGVELNLQYKLDPQLAAVTVKGLLRNSSAGRAGIEFISLTKKDRLALVKFCARLLTV